GKPNNSPITNLHRQSAYLLHGAGLCSSLWFQWVHTIRRARTYRPQTHTFTAATEDSRNRNPGFTQTWRHIWPILCRTDHRPHVSNPKTVRGERYRDLRIAIGFFPSGPYPTDRIRYKGEIVAEYRTPPQADGLGTYLGLGKSDRPINGAAMLVGAAPD